MDFTWTEVQRARRKEVVEFARAELNEGLPERERDSVFCRETWMKCAHFGLLRAAVPKEYGGSGFDILTVVYMMEGLGYGCHDNGLATALNAQVWTVQHPITKFGTDAQKEAYLPALSSGKLIGAHALTEPEAGSDAFSLRTTATKTDDGYLLTGKKRLITLAPVADVFLLFATTSRDAGRWGITAFLIDRDTEGLTIGPSQDKMGLRTAPLGEIEMADCRVPDAARLGKEGSGVAIANASLEYERSCMLASQLGVMERQLEEAVEYARTRQQFGKPIGKYQSVSNRIADMKVRLDAAQHLVYKVAWLKSSGHQAMVEAAVAKLFLTEAFVRSSEDALRIFGGTGYLSESGVERNLRDALAGTLYGGTSDIQRQVIARLVGL